MRTVEEIPSAAPNAAAIRRVRLASLAGLSRVEAPAARCKHHFGQEAEIHLERFTVQSRKSSKK
jgi:hypothetical protein